MEQASEDTEGSSSEEEVEVEAEQEAPEQRKAQETESDLESEEHETIPPAQVAKRKAAGEEPAKRASKKVKGAMSAYLIYWQEVQHTLKAENPALIHTDLARLCGQNWKALSVEEKQPYFDKAAADKSRYASERAAEGDEPAEESKKPRKTGFVLFCKANRRDLKRDYPDLAPIELRKMLSEKWKALSAEEKKAFNNTSAKTSKKAKAEGVVAEIDELVAGLRKKVQARMLRSDIGFHEMKGLLELVCGKANYELLRRLDAYPDDPADE